MEKKYKIGLTFGAFDLFHFGHLCLLKRAKELCQILIVCVSNDDYIKKHKDQDPIIPWEQRKAIINAICWVDKVGNQTLNFGKKEAVKKFYPNVLIVGNDWNSSTYTGEGLGVPVIYLPYTKDISTTQIIGKIKKLDR